MHRLDRFNQITARLQEWSRNSPIEDLTLILEHGTIWEELTEDEREQATYFANDNARRLDAMGYHRREIDA